mgnify:FL=1
MIQRSCTEHGLTNRTFIAPYTVIPADAVYVEIPVAVTEISKSLNACPFSMLMSTYKYSIVHFLELISIFLNYSFASHLPYTEVAPPSVDNSP